MRTLPILLVLLGTALRAAWGAHASPWLDSPDELGWGLLLDEAAGGQALPVLLSWYPHDGGAILVSLLALAVRAARPLALLLPPLAWVALLLDTAIRGAGVLAAERMAGARAGLSFAAFSVLAVPSLLDTSVVAAGHATAALFPLLLLLAAGRPLLAGAVAGLAVAWNLDGLVLLPALPLLAASLPGGRPAGEAEWGEPEGRGRAVAWALVACAVSAGGLLWLRSGLDLGFGLDRPGLFWIRGEVLALPGPLALNRRLFLSVLETLPGSSLLPALGPLPAVALRLSWGAILLGGLLGAAVTNAPRAERKATVAALLVLATFFVAYSASPFYYGSASSPALSPYRHLLFVLPLAVAASLAGLSRSRSTALVTVLFVCVGSAGSVATWLRSPRRTAAEASSSWRGAGWQLARKLGHDPALLERVASRAPEISRGDVAAGCGWGLAAATLGSRRGREASPEALARLSRAAAGLSPSFREAAVAGLPLAFAAGTTPRIDPALLPAARAAFHPDPGP